MLVVAITCLLNCRFPNTPSIYSNIHMNVPGSTLGEFIFLSVTFNSFRFWALVVLQIILIAALQGGTELDIELLVLHYVK